MDVTPLYENKIIEIGVIIKILKHGLLELLSFIRYSSLSYGLCSRIGSSVCAFIMKEPSRLTQKRQKY